MTIDIIGISALLLIAFTGNVRLNIFIDMFLLNWVNTDSSIAAVKVGMGNQ